MPSPPKPDKKGDIPNVLSDKEAKQSIQPIAEVFKIVFIGLDTTMSVTNKKGATSFVWRNTTEEQCLALAGMWVDMGKQNPVVASSTRIINKNLKGLKGGEILLPKAIQIFLFYLENGMGFAPNWMQLLFNGGMKNEVNR